jgi:hypothetical protein
MSQKSLPTLADLPLPFADSLISCGRRNARAAHLATRRCPRRW